MHLDLDFIMILFQIYFLVGKLFVNLIRASSAGISLGGEC